jgi:hypothetical protein
MKSGLQILHPNQNLSRSHPRPQFSTLCFMAGGTIERDPLLNRFVGNVDLRCSKTKKVVDTNMMVYTWKHFKEVAKYTEMPLFQNNYISFHPWLFKLSLSVWQN